MPFKPLTLLIKPASGLCNMDCGYCFYKNVRNETEQGIMTATVVDELILKVKEYAPSTLSVVFQGGEPTLAGLDFFKDFVGKLKAQVKGEIYFSLQTNGLLIDDAFAFFFKENNFLIGVSLDGNKETNDRYRVDKEGKSVFDRVIAGINLLKEHGVEFNVLSVIDDKNAVDIKETYEFFKKNGFGYLQFIPYVDEAMGVSLSEKSYLEFLKQSFDLWYDDIQKGEYVSVRNFDNYVSILMGRAPENCAMSGYCANYFVVEAGGDIYPCDFYCKKGDKISSVFDEKPFELNAKTKAFFDESLIIHSRCKPCKYYSLCRGGCKRDRVENFSRNKYCKAYFEFFDYSLKRMVKIARRLS